MVTTILRPLWHLDALTISLLSSTALLSAALGAVVFGRISDRLGRKFVYGYELLVLAAGAIASALSPNVFWLLIFRFILGMGVGGDYPVSSTLMSEYSNRRSRGKLITLVFSIQAIGLIIGPLLTILLLLNNVDLNLTWRLLLGLGAVPALATFWLRRQIAESPRFALAHGDIAEATRAIKMATHHQRNVETIDDESGSNPPDTVQANQSWTDEMSLPPRKKSWIEILTTPYLLIWLIGTAGAWFLLDFAYYGTTVSTPLVIKLFSPKTTLLTTMIYTLFIFVVAALPGYIVAVFTIDRIGGKKIQLLGFAMMTLSYGLLFLFPVLSTIAVTFLLLYGLSYFFTEFGPNVTTFVYPAEIFPVSVRSTGHGISAGVGKIGAFIGAFLFPLMLSNPAFRLPGAMGVAAIVALGGFLITFLLPEPDTKSLETIEEEGERLDEKMEEERKVRSKMTS